MAKKRGVTAKKPGARAKKQTPKRGAPKAMPVDYANVFRFLFAGATDAAWRDEIGSGDQQRVAAALTSVGIDLPAPDLALVVQTCLQIFALPGNAWNLFDNLRAQLLGAGGQGAA